MNKTVLLSIHCRKQTHDLGMFYAVKRSLNAIK